MDTTQQQFLADTFIVGIDSAKKKNHASRYLRLIESDADSF
jgi:hypothetical protein